MLRTMSRFDLNRKCPASCLHAVGLGVSFSETLLLSLSTIAGAKASDPPWVNFQSAAWVSFQSAPTGWAHHPLLRILHHPNQQKKAYSGPFVLKPKSLGQPRRSRSRRRYGCREIGERVSLRFSTYTYCSCRQSNNDCQPACKHQQCDGENTVVETAC